ncbi:MAG: hypothetical protein KGI29_04995 [Pseudomonadota bacterium]|nr:hypothetical protein [Pseudomonadota bacterium]MDE3037603.1 hypothetical protein [Pseudomonadota bacterium]
MAKPGARDDMENLPAHGADAAGNARETAKLYEFLHRYAPSRPGAKHDMLSDRYRIDLALPLPEWNTRLTRAYAATTPADPGRLLMAHVCPPEHAPRRRAISLLQSLTHRYILPLVAAGVAELSRPEEQRFVVIHERPAGKRLKEFLAGQPAPLDPRFLCDYLIAPLAAAIHQFAELDTAHGLINPDNIYAGDVPVLGPCVLEPCGYAQPFAYEAPERLLALPAGKGDGSAAQDYYALAVVALYALHGPAHFEGITPESLARTMFREGVYAALTRHRDVPEAFDDFFRGLLTQHPNDRWDYAHIKSWLEGKRFNVLEPPPPAEAVRPFECGDQRAYTRRELAYVLSQDWNKMAALVQNGQIMHWVSASLRDRELSDNIAHLSRHTLELTGRKGTQLAEQLICVLMLLDPKGPIRLKNMSFHVDGIDSLSVDLYAAKEQHDLQMLATFIGSNLTAYWLEQQRKDEAYTAPAAVAAILTRIDRLRAYIRNAGYGFGIERMLYDLNPELPCLSPMFSGEHIHTLPALLTRLDRMAAARAQDDDPIDRHIAAFIASRLGIAHDLRIHELAALPALADNRAVIALHLLSLAQKETEGLPLPGITHWLALRILPALESIHSRILRQKLGALLADRAGSGYTQLLADLIVNAGYAGADLAGFHKAQLAYQANAVKIDAYRKGTQISQQSARVGFAMAKAFAYLAVAFILLSIARENGL